MRLAAYAEPLAPLVLAEGFASLLRDAGCGEVTRCEVFDLNGGRVGAFPKLDKANPHLGANTHAFKLVMRDGTDANVSRSNHGGWDAVVSAPETLIERWLAPAGAVDAPSGHAASLHLRADLAVDAALIAAVTAGCAQALLRARTGGAELAARARIHDDGDLRIVTMPLEAVRIAVRKSGLDRDPGWVPWLERHVRIVFDENI